MNKAELVESVQKTLGGDTSKAAAERAFVLLQMGAATAGQDAEAAKGLYQESLDRYVTLGDAWFIAEALLGLAYTSLIQGDFDSQRSYVQDALDTYTALRIMNAQKAGFDQDLLRRFIVMLGPA